MKIVVRFVNQSTTNKFLIHKVGFLLVTCHTLQRKWPLKIKDKEAGQAEQHYLNLTEISKRPFNRSDFGTY